MANSEKFDAIVLTAMVQAFPRDTKLVVLDWQHTSYRFWPHRQRADEARPWPITPFPNGDYYIFLTEDMTHGTFGHPWEKSFCVFGPSLIDALIPPLAEWLPVKRQR